MKRTALLALFSFALAAAACTGSTQPSDVSADSLDAAMDARTECESLCAPVTERCTNIDTASCVSACERQVPFRDAGPDAMAFDPRGCLNASASCGAISTCLGGPPIAPFSMGPYGTHARDIAGPITLATTDGDWSLQDHWTGEDSYVFLTFANGALVDQNNADYLVDVFSSWSLDILDKSPPNVHYFFMTYRAADANDVWSSFQSGVLADLDSLPAEQQAHWRPRIHFVTTPVQAMGNWISDRARAFVSARYGLPYDIFTFAIDRSQRLREIGQLGILTGNGSVLGDMTYVAYEPQYYNFEWDRAQRLAGENATIIPVVPHGTTVTSEVVENVAFPDAATMATFDGMELDLSIDCADHVDGHCSPWDYLSNLYLCDPPDPANPTAPPVCTTEVARWITSYWREGRWVTDVSDLLPLFRQGGMRQLKWYASEQWTTHTDYIVDLNIRLFHRGGATSPSEAVRVYAGDSFHPMDANQFAPYTFTVPADVRSVKVYALITGHGAEGNLHCAEFCNHTHHFQVNSAPEHVLAFPGAGTRDGCTEDVVNGTVPNQHGTWYLGRGGWCPGSDVRPWIADITSDVVRGGPNTLTYRPIIAGRPPTTGSGNSVVTVWLVYGR